MRALALLTIAFYLCRVATAGSGSWHDDPPHGFRGPFAGACRSLDGGRPPWGFAADNQATAQTKCMADIECVGFAYTTPLCIGAPYAEYYCRQQCRLCPYRGTGPLHLTRITTGDGRLTRPNICYGRDLPEPTPKPGPMS